MLNFSKISSLADYLNTIDAYQKKQAAAEIKYELIFRGQNGDWPLIPGIARMADSEDLPQIEQSMFNDFKRQAVRYLSFRPDNDWEWLTIGQHYGLPTRLLDWSTNPLTSLWFAVNSGNTDENGSGVVWIYQSDESNLVKNTDTSPFEISVPKVYLPQHNNTRIYAQSGIFTIHNYLEQKMKFVPLQEDTRENSKLAKITIPGSCFKSISKELERVDIHSAKLFPDLDGLTKRIRQLYS